MRARIQRLLLVTVMVIGMMPMGVSPAFAEYAEYDETPIVEGPLPDTAPDIDWPYVVYSAGERSRRSAGTQENGTDPISEIRVYNMETGEDFAIPGDGSDDVFRWGPASISGDRIVYMAESQPEVFLWGPSGLVGSNPSVRMYDLSTGTESIVFEGSGRMYDPFIYGDIVAWSYYSQAGPEQIWMKDLASGVEAAVAPSPMSYQYLPTVWENYIAWYEWSSDTESENIKLYDVVTSTETTVAVGYHDIGEDVYLREPFVYDGKVAFGTILCELDDDWFYYNSINLYDIETGETETVSTERDYERFSPVMRDGWITWTDTRNSWTPEIWGYDLASEEETLIVQAYGDIGIRIDEAPDPGRLAQNATTGSGWVIWENFLGAQSVPFGLDASVMITEPERDYSQPDLHAKYLGDPADFGPVAVDDEYSTGYGEPIDVEVAGVLENDYYQVFAWHDEFNAVLVDDVENGELALAADGSFAYSPDEGFFGEDTFTYEVLDGALVSNTAAVTITVGGPSGISGAVYSVQGAVTTGIEDAEVTVWTAEADPSVVATATTDASGGYAVEVDPGEYVVEFAAEGYGSQFYDGAADLSDATAVTVEAEAFTPDIDAEFVVAGVNFVELGGEDRYATAIAISQAAYPDGLSDEGTKTVVLARGERFPDALAGASIAGLVDGPILLTRSTSLLEVVADEIERLGAERVILLGETLALSVDVETAVAALDGVDSTMRFGGESRYETADAIAEYVIGELGDEFGKAAFVATGERFPDSLTASPMIAAQGMPLFLARPVAGLSTSSVAVMTESEIESATILGGTLAVSSGVESALEELLGEDGVERVAGADRYETAAEVAAFGVSLGHTWDKVGIAAGDRFPDPLTGGVYQGKSGSVMLLTRPATLNEYARSALEDNAEEITEVRVYGGPVAITQAVRDAIKAIFGM